MKFLLLLALFTTAAQAGELRLLEAEKVGFEGYQIEDFRDAYYPYNKPGTGGEEWTVGATFVMNVTLAAYDQFSWYWDNRPHMTATDAQVREAGWEWENGVSYNRKIDIYWHHHSRHVLDTDQPGKYPLYNAYGFRIIFYERGK